jgi:N6-L-threonylcarbamoyladenine synthase
VLLLAIETSCDETSAAVVKDGPSTPSMELGTSSLGASHEVLSNVVSSQVEFHKKYGGIVPELAARKHIEVISPVIQEAMERASVGFKEIDAVAVTYGPGLVGSLIVGLCAAKAIAWSLNVPLIGVNHLEGHIYANFLVPIPQFPVPQFPFICLLVSGGHTMIILVEDHGKYRTLGRTRDDAAGEAFDKVARFLGLSYPGGPIIDKLAKEGNPKAIRFTRPMLEGYDFSFSGIKTAVVNFVNKNQETATFSRRFLADLVASFQQAVVDVLVEKTIRAAKEFNCRSVALAGGVSANSLLRKRMEDEAKDGGFEVHIPSLEYCTDNAAMIATAGYYKYINSSFVIRNSAFDLSPVASARI